MSLPNESPTPGGNPFLPEDPAALSQEALASHLRFLLDARDRFLTLLRTSDECTELTGLLAEVEAALAFLREKNPTA